MGNSGIFFRNNELSQLFFPIKILNQYVSGKLSAVISYLLFDNDSTYLPTMYCRASSCAIPTVTVFSGINSLSVISYYVQLNIFIENEFLKSL